MTKTKIRIQKVPLEEVRKILPKVALEELKKIFPPEVLYWDGNQSAKVKKKAPSTSKGNSARSRS